MPHFLSTEVKLALLILSLGIDSLTVAIGLGISGVGKKNKLRVGSSFALFEGGMPLVGFFLGHILTHALGEITSILGIIVLFGIGVWIIIESFRDGKESKPAINTWNGLLLTSLTVSLDELAVGFSMGALGFPIVLSAILIAVQAFIFTYLGTTLGNKIGEKLAEKAELIAGIVLCGLAILLIAEKLFNIKL